MAAPPKFKRSMTMTGIDDGNVDVPKIFKLKQEYLKNDMPTIQKSITDHVEFSLACTKYNFDNSAAYRATAQSVRDRVLEFWNDTQQCYTEKDPRRVYYLSLEFLMGRSLSNAVHNLELEDPYSEALKDLGYKLEEIADEEKDAALGNGGLGRLAACFMDSLSTLNYPAWGYGIRYNFGMFEQGFHDGWQTELPDYWLTYGNPWEIQRRDIHYPVRFYGTVETTVDPATGTKRSKWEGGELVVAEAYDTPIPGYRTHNTNNIRLWSSKPNREFDLEMFNKGDYFSAVEGKERSENITSVLYPNDSTAQGKELRLKQQYFFCAATLSDIVRRFKKIHGSDLAMLPEKVVIQLNDTHPAISIVELMRKLIDEEGLDWETSWTLTRKTFCYTNHTILPEALEHWPVSLIERLLPRHMQLIYDINLQVLQEVEKKWPGDIGKLSKISIIAEGEQKQVRMANLAIIGSRTVNGVAALHTFLLRTKVFPEFDEFWPGKFRNITNGVTPRRWIQQANPGLSKLFNKWLKTDNWVKDLSLLRALREHAKNPELQNEWRAVKLENKRRLIGYINSNCPVEGGISEDAIFDVQIKRIHEYKRQLLNILGVIARYQWIKKLSEAEKKNVVKRVVIFGGKAAAAYHMAKRIIKLINSVSTVINSDKDVGNLLKVIFIPNYCVSNAEIIIPASDINQQISTAGTEASGTGNMKFTMNGSLIIGTMDGANVEIAEEIGEENMFIFGLRTADLVEKHRQRMKQRVKAYIDQRLHEVLSSIEEGVFGPSEYYHDILSYFDHDYYALIPDFPPYMEAQKAIDELYRKPEEWTQKSILGSAGTSKFSADRTIQEYAETIWDIKPAELPRSDVRWGARKYVKGH